MVATSSKLRTSPRVKRMRELQAGRVYPKGEEPKEETQRPKVKRQRQSFAARYRLSLIQRINTLSSTIIEQPIDVRFLAAASRMVGLTIAGMVLEYARIRSFINVVSGGFCEPRKARDRLRLFCERGCSWYHRVDDNFYCRGCDCPAWVGSKIQNKAKFARFACPKGRFSQLPGWIGRFWEYLKSSFPSGGRGEPRGDPRPLGKG